MLNIKALFAAAMLNYKNKQKNRLLGKHCRARLLRAQAKRTAAGKKAYTP